VLPWTPGTMRRNERSAPLSILVALVLATIGLGPGCDDEEECDFGWCSYVCGAAGYTGAACAGTDCECLGTIGDGGSDASPDGDADADADADADSDADADADSDVDSDADSDADGGCGTHPLAVPFAATTLTFSETEDLDAACTDELGPCARLADWEEVCAYYEGGGDMAAFMAAAQLTGYDFNALVKAWGEEFYDETRHFFITRHDHVTPGDYFAVDHIDDHLINLGCWYGLDLRALCYLDE